MRSWIKNALPILVAVVGIIAVCWGSTYSVPDLVEIRYGLPLMWGGNILNTIAGPVDRWRVDIASLVVDLVFWFGAVLAVFSILQMRK